MVAHQITPKSNQPLLWVSALVLSVGLHVGLVHLNPNLFLGSGDLVSAPTRQSRKTIRVAETSAERMRQELPKLLDRFTPIEDSSATESPIDLPDPAASMFEEAAAKLPDPQINHRSSDVLSETPELSKSMSDWQPRQEILAIKDQRVEEVLDVLPRRVRETRFDRPGAPDISLPGTLPPDLEDSDAFQISYQPLSQGVVSGEGSIAGVFPFGVGSTPNASAPLLMPLGLPEIELSQIEPLNEVTEFEAVESLLRLETRVLEDPIDPNVRYFKVQLLPQGIDTLPVLPRDLVYLLDCSASMTERKLRLAIEGINSSLENVSEQDTVNVVAFRDQVEVLSDQGISASVFGKAKIRTFLSSLHARGQTDVYASLDALQTLPKEAGRPMLAMLVTDGVPTQGVTDSSEIIENFSKANKGEASVFGLGGGRRVNRLLLDFLSFRNRGSSLVAPRAEGLPAMINQASEEIRRPVLMNLRYQFTGTQEPEVYPQSLSHLYLDRPLILIGRLPKTQKRIAFQIIGASAKGNHDMVFSIDLDTVQQGSSSLRQEWAWQALLERLSSTIGNPNPDIQAELETLIETYDLVIPEAYR